MNAPGRLGVLFATVVVSLSAVALMPRASGPLWSDDPLVIDAANHHLGDDQTPEWPEAPVQPEGTRLEWTFLSISNPRERVLALWQRHVDALWTLTLNGQFLATLVTHPDRREELYPVPAGRLRNGENILRLIPGSTSDDITLGELRLYDQSLRERLDLIPVTITVSDRDTGEALPVRITLRGLAGELPRLFHGEEHGAALRPGLVYSADGEAHFEVTRGNYDVWASRGTEWSVDRGRLEANGASAALALSLVHELKLQGMVAVDTHLHTLTFSGHGDASVEERVATLAGEGVELAIATDHNHNTDYRPIQLAEKLGRWFTPVVGNEVTTSIGHFNGFPLDAADEVPDQTLDDWAGLVAEIRARGAEVVILNHPRWPDHERGPFGVTGLNSFTGARASGAAFTFDALEVVNSTTEEADPRTLIRDWFSLLGRGEGLVAVGSSDSHTVNDPVGQGRTYVVSGASDAGQIDVSEVCRNIVAGRCSVSLGIFADLRTESGAGMGDLLSEPGRTLKLQVHVAAPTWVQPRKVLISVNGVVQRELPLYPMDGVHDEWLPLTLSLPAHDAYVVAVVLGAAIHEPFWPMVNDYTLAVTNPIFVDGDGDGRWSSPREIARARLRADSQDGTVAVSAYPQDLDQPTLIHYFDLDTEQRVAAARARARSLAEERAADAGLLREFLDSRER